MSLILDALKKSEAERRLGQVPGLMTPVQRVTPRRRIAWPAMLLSALVLVGAGAAVAWWWMPPRSARDMTASEVHAPAPTPAAATVERAPEAAPAPATPRTATPSAPRAPSAPATPTELPSDPDFVSTERESLPIAAQTRPSHDTASPPPRSKPTAPAATTAVPAPPSQASEPVLPVPTRVAPAEPDAAQDVLPRLVDLPAEERQALPPLKLSMHVYTAEAASRFVVIDGQRLTEGARMANGLTLTTIRRDGAVFEFNGRRFLVPRL